MVALTGMASACGSATVVNAIAAGKGAAFGVELRVFARVELLEGSGEIVGRLVGERGESPELIEICVRKVLEHLGVRETYGARVETRSEVPIAVGLSSSSAAANAVVLATFAALGRRPRPEVVLNLGIDAAFEAGVTITGALDDAAASLHGCGVVTDNLRRRILKKFKVDPKLKVLVHVPPAKFYTSKVRRAQVEPIREAVEAVHRMALRGEIFDALTLNGLLYSSALGQDPMPALEALANGALAAGMTGTGPATVAVAEPDAADEIGRAWQARPGRIIKTEPAVKGGRIERP
jgi:shikimate kinase